MGIGARDLGNEAFAMKPKRGRFVSQSPRRSEAEAREVVVVGGDAEGADVPELLHGEEVGARCPARGLQTGQELGFCGDEFVQFGTCGGCLDEGEYEGCEVRLADGLEAEM